jgi:hypothetical protein
VFYFPDELFVGEGIPAVIFKMYGVVGGLPGIAEGAFCQFPKHIGVCDGNRLESRHGAVLNLAQRNGSTVIS